MGICSLIGFLIPSCKKHESGANHHMHKTSFDDLVKRFEDPERETWQKPEWVISLVEPLASKTVVDIGAGTGYFAVKFAAKGANVIATDIDERFLQYMKERKAKLDSNVAKNLTILKIEEDGTGLPANVDLFYIVDVYHHIENRVDYLKNLRKKLKKGGKLMIVDFYKKELPVGPPPKIKLSREEVQKELESAGFKVEKTLTDLPYQYILIAS